MADTEPDDQALAQGDLRLLETPTAVELLGSAIPARIAYVTRAGSPRIVPTWFHWTGDEFVMATWVRGPHVHTPARRVQDLRSNPLVAISIDTNEQPPRVLQMRGSAVVEEVNGIVAEYELAAQRYLGVETARAYLDQFDAGSLTMARISVRPDWVGVLDFAGRLPDPLGGVRR